MFYPKNVPTIERIGRVISGIALIIVGLWRLSAGSADAVVVTVLLISTAVFIMVTGFIGWCPACAMVGRKLKQKETR
ncbi:MAG: DUF2892 domain-containing protein [Chloroflexi bacterium]|nr:DUF2892 domain-containing protein [Chloroflexota bacterium]